MKSPLGMNWRATRPYSAKPLLTRLALQQSHGPQPCRFGRKLGVRQTLQRYWAERTLWQQSRILLRIGEISTNRRFTLLFLRRFLTRLRAHLRHTLTIFQQEAAQRQIFLMAQRLTLSRRSAIITTVLAWYLCTRQYIRTYKKTV